MFLGSSYMDKAEETKDVELLDKAESLLTESLQYEGNHNIAKRNLAKVKKLRSEFAKN